ncbi:MAG: hypothetical protein HY814_01090 [Candidatus Riflebacteria bacterium]|nr:hypothetical protein [Candidatus Riflebacteria bacterium]
MARATAMPHLGPKRRAQLEAAGMDAVKRALGYLLGVLVLGFSLLQASRVLSEHGSDSGMVNVLIGLFAGIIILFLVSHDSAVARRQGIEE